jgi:hypothetical protein
MAQLAIKDGIALRSMHCPAPPGCLEAVRGGQLCVPSPYPMLSLSTSGGWAPAEALTHHSDLSHIYVPGKLYNPTCVQVVV